MLRGTAAEMIVAAAPSLPPGLEGLAKTAISGWAAMRVVAAPWIAVAVALPTSPSTAYAPTFRDVRKVDPFTRYVFPRIGGRGGVVLIRAVLHTTRQPTASVVDPLAAVPVAVPPPPWDQVPTRSPVKESIWSPSGGIVHVIPELKLPLMALKKASTLAGVPVDAA